MAFGVVVLGGDKAGIEHIKSSIKPEFDAICFERASQAFEAMSLHKPDLLIMIDDPADMSALTCLQVLLQTQGSPAVPVMMLSSRRGEERLLQAFDLGVEDYLGMPCDPRELVARGRAVLRRRRETPERFGGSLELGGIEIDPSQRRCLVRGRRVSLQPREFELLEVLMRKAGRVLSRAYLLETVWGMSSEADTRAVDVAVSRVRRKLGSRSSRWIETVSKLGYCFTKS